MESQILNEIRRTNELLEWSVYLLIAIVALWILRGTFAAVRNWKRIKNESLNEAAKELYQKGSYYEVMDLCSKNLKKRPKDLYGLYWKAKAQNRVGKTEGLVDAIESLLDIAPRWKEDWMDEYIKDKESQPAD